MTRDFRRGHRLLLFLVVSWTELAAEPPAMSGQELPLHEVISRTESALGGKESLRLLQSLRFTMGDGPKALRWEIILPSRVRKERNGGLVLVFDGETFLPAEIRLPEWDYRRVLDDYVDFGGILFSTCSWDSESPESVPPLHGLEWNVDLTFGRFTLPEGMGDGR